MPEDDNDPDGFETLGELRRSDTDEDSTYSSSGAGGFSDDLDLDDLEPLSEPPGGRSIYADYIKEQLDAQEARKVSLEQRGWP